MVEFRNHRSEAAKCSKTNACTKVVDIATSVSKGEAVLTDLSFGALTESQAIVLEHLQFILSDLKSSSAAAVQGDLSQRALTAQIAAQAATLDFAQAS